MRNLLDCDLASHAEVECSAESSLLHQTLLVREVLVLVALKSVLEVLESFADGPVRVAVAVTVVSASLPWVPASVLMVQVPLWQASEAVPLALVGKLPSSVQS